MQRALAGVLVLSSAAISGCGYRHLAPGDPPPKVTPALTEPAGEAPPGLARVYLDVVQGPTPVELVVDRRTEVREAPSMSLYLGPNVGTQSLGGGPTSHVVSKRQPVCTTPCWAELPVGAPVLVLGGEEAELAVGPGRSAYVRSLGRHDPPSLGRTMPWTILGALGLGAVVTGPLVAIADDGATGVGMTLAGLAAAVLGFVLYQDARPVEQPGVGASHGLP